MSERFPHNFEQDYKPNKIENSTEQLEAYKYSIENRTKKNEQIEDARSNIEKLAISKEKTVAKPEKYKSQETTPRHQYITKKIKNESYQKTLKIIRKDLAPSQKIMSKFIHQKIIESVSEVGAKTIARPSGIIGGGLLALVGSLLVLVVARKVGFEVPYSLFAVLFIIGFVLGLIVEFTRNIFKKITKKV
jgi:hypothetical protein